MQASTLAAYARLCGQRLWVVGSVENGAVALMPVARSAGSWPVGLRPRRWIDKVTLQAIEAYIHPNYCTHDGVIPRTKLPEVLAEIANVFHTGDGNLHTVVVTTNANLA